MKTRACVLIVALFVTVNGFSQQLYAVFHDKVKPSLDGAYRENLKKLKSAVEQNKVPFYWITVAFDDNSYSHLVPIKAFADLDKDMLADLHPKIGSEAVGQIFAEFGRCTESQTSYVVKTIPAFSYLVPIPPGENFRDITFWYYLPEKRMEAEALIKEWIKLYQSKNAPSGISTFEAVFGEEPGYAFVSWGKNPLDLVTKETKNNELFGEDAKKLWAKTLSISKRFVNKRAWVLPDHSVLPPAPPVAATK